MRRRPPGRRRTVVPDLDGTLAPGDAFGAFLLRRWLRSPLRLLAALTLAPLVLLRRRAELLVVATATVGTTDAALHQQWRELALRHTRGGGVREALDRFAAHRAAGDRVVVATACAEPLARLVLDALGVGDVELVATAHEHRRWRTPRASPIRGEAKVEALRRAGVDLPVDEAYSDSLRDLPLLRAARTPHLVRPRRRDLVRWHAHLGAVEVLGPPR
ncbi:haloacid dehalogenase-like hydrolase [Kineococcus sp. NPDC059986]|uniref:haloacid dehalogenase-like hydrolase n=1 Tax=Kineococcus sp. NPDC059986 TaxID=3155538 RepID=UPI00344C6A71